MFDPGQATPTTTDVVAALRDADAACARAVGLLLAVGAGTIARDRAMPAEIALATESRWNGRDVTTLFHVAETLASLPLTRAALATGAISYSQARQIASALKHVPAAARAAIDERIDALAGTLAEADPDALIAQVEHAATLARPDLELRREDRRVERGYLAISPYLDGSGGTFHGECDATGLATIAAAVEAEAEQPVSAEDDVFARGRQRAEALVRICEDALAGRTIEATDRAARPRARMLVSVDARDLRDLAEDGARILWGLAGGPGRLSRVATEQELCDAEVQLVLFDGSTPLAVGDARAQIPGKVRAAVTARDGGCRFPGCRAPVAWSQIHHIRARGGHRPSNLVMLCTRCHRRMHRRPWSIEHRPGGLIAFTHRGRTITSTPRARPLRN